MKNIAPIPFLKLDPSRSFIKPGESVEVECTSSVGPQVRVTWERPDRAQLPSNVEVRFKIFKDRNKIPKIKIHFHSNLATV